MDQVISYLSSTYKAGSAAVSGRFWDQDSGVMDELQQRGDYRKVAGVFSFDSVNNSGVDVLFSLDYVFSSQIYFNYMQNFGGFDLVTWQVLKEWMELREKMFATKIHYMFDNRTQLLRLLPEPGVNFSNRYIGIIGAYVEKPIRDLLPEQWVQKYTLALTKIMLGHVRGKMSNVSLMGGGTLNFNDVMTQGLEEKKQLEENLMNVGESNPVSFFVG